jgi:formate dehydrogenase alpha subunit
MENTVSAAPKFITIKIDGQAVKAPAGSTVLEAALNADIYIPTLCYDPDLKPYGACCLCVVEIEGMRGLPTSCTTPATDGMVVHTESPQVNQSRLISMELIMANHQGECLTCAKNQNCELQKVARYLGVEQARFDRMRRGTPTKMVDESTPAYTRDMNKCILCGRCWRACQEIACINAIDISYRGDTATVGTLGNKPIIESSCVSCGECIERCPTGALLSRNTTVPSREVKTICP